MANSSVFRTLRSIYSEPTDFPKKNVYIRQDHFKRVEIDPRCVLDETEPDANICEVWSDGEETGHFNNYVPEVDCKHRVLFDCDVGGRLYKNQTGLMSALDIAAVLSESLKKRLIEEESDFSKRRKLDQKNDKEVAPMSVTERHCLAWRDDRVHNNAKELPTEEGEFASVDQMPKWRATSNFVRVENCRKRKLLKQ